MQVLPFAIVVGLLYVWLRYRKKREAPLREKLLHGLFVCYITGLLCLVGLLQPINALWYRLLYHRTGWLVLYGGGYSITLDFWKSIDRHMLGNIMAFMPFGLLYPKAYKKNGFWKTILAGLICTVIIECIQPFFGRVCDINDIVTNFIGVLISAGIVSAIRIMLQKRQG